MMVVVAMVVAAAAGMGYKAVETGFCHFRGEETAEAQENESLPFFKKVKTSGHYQELKKKTIKVN